jgi:phosphonate transport system substrate-binding protein
MSEKEEFMVQRSGRTIWAAVIAAVLFFSQTTWAKDSYIMGVHPYKPAFELYKIFKPITDYVSKRLGKPVELQIGKSYEDAVKKIGAGEFDFAYLGPTIYIEAKDKHGVIPLAQIVNNGKPTFYGVIVAKKGGGVSSLKDLKGKRFGFGDRDSTLTHVLPLYMLLESGVGLADLKEYRFVGSHDKVAEGVSIGMFDAAGLMPDIADKYMDRGLEVIAKSPDLPEHVFVATKSMDAKTVETPRHGPGTLQGDQGLPDGAAKIQ